MKGTKKPNMNKVWALTEKALELLTKRGGDRNKARELLAAAAAELGKGQK